MKRLLQKYRSLNVRARSALWFTICNFLQKGISFITTPIFLRILTTEQYGTYSLYLSWLQVFTVLSTLYLYHGVTDNAMAKFEDDRSRFISSMQGLTITLTSGVALLFFLLSGRLQKWIGLAPILMLLMFTEIYAIPAFFFWSARQRFEYRYRSLVAVTLLKSLLNPCLGLLAVHYAGPTALSRVAAAVSVECAVCGVLMVIQFVQGKTFFDKNYWKYALTLAIPMVPHYLAGIILNHGDRIMISKLVGKPEVALYGVAYSIGMLVLLFVNAINSAMTPWVYSKLKISDIKAIRSRSREVIAIVFCLAVGLMLISPEVVRIFGSAKYAQSVYVIPPVAGSVFFVYLYGFLSFPEFYYEKTSFLMIASLFAAGLNVVLNYIFIPRYGFVAAAYTTLTCYVIYSLGHYIVGRSILTREAGERSMVDETMTLVLGVVLIVISCTIHMLFPSIFIRYALVAAGMLIAFVKRKDIYKIINAK